MPRGGHHPHAKRWGRTKSWNNASDTKTIRVPEALADEVLEIAHKLDRGEAIAYVSESMMAEIESLKEVVRQLTEERDNLKQQLMTQKLKPLAESVGLEIEPMPTNDLARRLNVVHSAIRYHVKKGDLPKWSAENDPDGIRWHPKTGSKNFYPEIPKDHL